MLHAMDGYVIVEPLPPNKTIKSTLIIPDTVKRDYDVNNYLGIVVAIGVNVYDVQVGDTVRFKEIVHWNVDKPYHAKAFEDEGKTYLGLKENDILWIEDHVDTDSHPVSI